jgi:uncharacterized membrane protein
MQFKERFIEIDAPVEHVFDLFSNFENFPRWMRNIKDVHYSGRHFTRWTAAAPFGTTVEWEAETIVFQPDRKISWHSVRGDIDTEGEVIFEETRRGTTRLHVVLGYKPPAGRMGEIVAELFGVDPGEQLEDDLERFAAVAEGRRSIAPYRDERRSRGSSNRSDANSRDRHRARLQREQYGRGRTEARFVERDAVFDSSYSRNDPSHDRRSRFDRELSAARISQIQHRFSRPDESRNEHRQRYLERDAELRSEAARERNDRDDRHRGVARDASDDRHPRYRYAMTPREREREIRELDRTYPERAFSRGVDKLLDDPPSSRWRR